MLVRECMTREVAMTHPHETLAEAARAMAECDAGVLPVSDGDRLVGMITDRDIAIRGMAEGLGPSDQVEMVMTREVRYCFDDDEVEDVLQNMGDLQLRRLPVLSRDKRLVGIVSLSDLALEAETAAGEALQDITRPGGQHSQHLH